MNALQPWLSRQMALLSALLGQRESAERWWRRLLAQRSDDVQALASLGHLRAEAKDLSTAVALLERVVALGAASPALWFNLGYVRQEAGEHERAVEAFDRAIAGDEKLDRAWYGKALSLIRLGRVEEAVPLLVKNTELQPMSPFGWYQLAHAYHRLGQTERVERTIRRLAGFEPKVARQLEQETGVHVGVEVLPY